MKVIHIITGLSAGGAETMLYRLLASMDARSVESEVICLNEGGPMEAKIKGLGVDVLTLGMPRKGFNPVKFARLVRHLRDRQPDVVQTWMYHGDLLGGTAARMAGRKAVVWNIRHGNLQPGVNKRLTLWTARLCGYLSRFIPVRIICNSEASVRIHERFGYVGDRFIVIPNGFDPTRFSPSIRARNEVRHELGLGNGAVLVGLIARFHPQKDHANFIAAAAAVSRRMPEAHFILVGKDVDEGNPGLTEAIGRAGLGGRIRLLGHREDIPRLTAALDVACSSSCGEGFPNAIGEAMASGVPCVVTDVGDSGSLVGNTGRVVPSGSPVILADSILELLAMEPGGREELGRAARKRILDNFDLNAVAKKYFELYETVRQPSHG